MTRYTVSRSIEVAAPAKRVWETVRDFGAFEVWFPTSEEVSPQIVWTGDRNEIGVERHIIFDGGPRFCERLISIDEDQSTISYSLVESPFPIDDHLAMLHVQDRGGKSLVTWSATFCAEDESTFAMMDSVMGSQNFEPGLAGLKRYIEKQDSKPGS